MKAPILSLALLLCIQLHAQTFAITGMVKDAETKEAISYCSIIGPSTKAITNTKGVFSIALPTHSFQLIISSIGYVADTITIEKNKTHYIIFLQQSQSILNDVVVTGTSKATLLRENPIAITSVSSKAIDKTIEANIIDALVKNVPGLNAVKTGPNISKPFIRGLGYNRVLTLYDGVRQEGQQWGDEHGIEVDAYNIDKVEVIKGPASLMFGSDAVAGIVSLFPFLPKEKDGKVHGKVVSEYQHNNALIGNGFRISYANNKWLWLMKGSYRLAKNYSNNIDGRIYNTSFRETNFAFTTAITSLRGFTNFNFTLYNNLQGIPDGSRDSLTRKFTKQIYEGILDNVMNRPLVTTDELNSYALSPLHQHIQHYRLYSNNHYKINKGEIDATIGFQQNVRKEFSHPTAIHQPSLFVRLNTINYGIKYITTLYSTIETSIGINGMYQNNLSKNATDFPIPNYSLLDAGMYLFAKWKHEKITISGGLRYDTRTINSKDFYVGKNLVTGFDQQYFLPDTSGSKLQFAALKKQFDGVSLSIGFAYQLSEQINLKVNVARGYRSPNITEIASNGLDPGAHIIYLGNRNFIPEFSFQQDVGFHANFKNIAASISVFNNTIQNYIYLTQLVDANNNAIVDAQGNKTFQYQQAAAQLHGLEASLELHPTAWKGFSFSNNFSIVLGINKKNEFKHTGIEGEYLPLIPPAKWLSSVNKELNISGSVFKKFTTKIELEYSAAQNRYLALYNTETSTPAYALVNFSVGTQLKYSKTNTLQLQLQANNLFNYSYQSNLSRLKYFEYYNSSPTGNLGMYNMGRNICAKLIIVF